VGGKSRPITGMLLDACCRGEGRKLNERAQELNQSATVQVMVESQEGASLPRQTSKAREVKRVNADACVSGEKGRPFSLVLIDSQLLR